MPILNTKQVPIYKNGFLEHIHLASSLDNIDLFAKRIQYLLCEYVSGENSIEIVSSPRLESIQYKVRFQWKLADGKNQGFIRQYSYADLLAMNSDGFFTEEFIRDLRGTPLIRRLVSNELLEEDGRKKFVYKPKRRVRVRR